MANGLTQQDTAATALKESLIEAHQEGFQVKNIEGEETSSIHEDPKIIDVPANQAVQELTTIPSNHACF